MRRLLAFLIAGCVALATLVACTPGSPTPAREFNRTVGVQLFQWPWTSIATECTEVLGPAGFGFVLTSPPQEHIQGPEWWTSYQPVSYQLESKLGTREEFAAMVTACHEADVKVIADAVINHMAGIDGGTGVAGTSFTHYEYPGLYTYDDFHHCGLTPSDDIQNYSDQQQVQECELSNLADLKTSSDHVRSQIVAYLTDLQSLGVDGFRIDAAKHMVASDVQAIVGALEGDPIIIAEVIRGSGEPVQPEDYLGFASVFAFQFAKDLASLMPGGAIGRVLDLKEANVPSEQAYTFVSNHDSERDKSTLRYLDGLKFDLATVLMLAVPFGTPVVYSGYAFRERDLGARSDDEGLVLPVSCVADSGPEAVFEQQDWICQHRWRHTLGMVEWRSVVGDAEVANYWSEGYAVAFDRSELGFIAASANSVRVLEDVVFTTSLPDGKYCNVLTAPTLVDVAADPDLDRCPTGEYEVSGGTVTITLEPMSAVALHVNLREN